MPPHTSLIFLKKIYVFTHTYIDVNFKWNTIFKQNMYVFIKKLRKTPQQKKKTFNFLIFILNFLILN